MLAAHCIAYAIRIHSGLQKKRYFGAASQIPLCEETSSLPALRIFGKMFTRSSANQYSKIKTSREGEMSLFLKQYYWLLEKVFKNLPQNLRICCTFSDTHSLANQKLQRCGLPCLVVGCGPRVGSNDFTCGCFKCRCVALLE